MKLKEKNLIKNTDLFFRLEDSEFENIIEKCRYKILNFQKDEYVAFRGDDIDGVYINLEGILVAEMLKDDGNVKKIEELGKGRIVASAFIFGNVNKFPIDLVAKSKVKVLFIEKNEVVELLKSNSKILKIFLDEISNKAQFLSKNLWESLSNKTINQKLVEYMLKNEKDGIIIFNNSIKELSEYFNVSRPSLSRVIKNIIEEGVIERVEKGKYKILLREKLLKIK